jgi:hypothetical protein
MIRAAATTRRSGTAALMLATVALAAPVTLLADGPVPGPLPAGLLECRSEADDVRRLACFDREIARSGPSAEQRFGYRGEVARESLDREKAAAPALERLQAKVQSISTTPSGDWVVTLDNGQTWAQVPTGMRYSLRVGDAVTITPGALGSFLLRKDDGGSAVRVRRRR